MIPKFETNHITQLSRHFDFIQVNDDIIEDLVFKNIKQLQDYEEREKFIFFYHKDHLGSSTQISDRDAKIIHHPDKFVSKSFYKTLETTNSGLVWILSKNQYSHNFSNYESRLNVEYMPTGEQFSEQRDWWATPYKFNGKELDAETGLYYYGARYYTPEIGIWLSACPPKRTRRRMDPLSDERPSLSPYNYCQLNPVMRVDPTGMLDDEFGVTSTGEVKLLKRKSGDHELYKLDNNGKKVDVNGDGKMSEGTDFVKFGRKDVKSAIRFNISIIDHEHRETGRSFGNRADFSNQESAENIFNFITCQKNTDTWKTDVEYSLADLEKGNNRISLLTTGRSSESAIGSRNHVLKNTDKGFRLTRHIHNHPSNNPNPSTGYDNGDIDFKNKIQHVGSSNTLFQIKTKHGISNY